MKTVKMLMLMACTVVLMTACGPDYDEDETTTFDDTSSYGMETIDTFGGAAVPLDTTDTDLLDDNDNDLINDDTYTP